MGPTTNRVSRRSLMVAAAGSLLTAPIAVNAQSGDRPHHAAGASHDHTGAIATGRDAPDVSQSPFYSEMARVNARMHEGMAILPSGDIAHDFMRMMIPHHQGAIDMALVLLKHGRDEKLRRLAQSIIVEQGQEVAYMRSLLATPPGQMSNTKPIADR